MALRSSILRSPLLALCLIGGILFFLAPVWMLIHSTVSLADSDNFWHIVGHYTPTTLLLCLAVAGIAFLMGVIPAFFVSLFEFPGKNIVKFALVLPLAIPVYLLSFIYGELLDYSGPVQQTWRTYWGYSRAAEYYFWDIRSFEGLALLMGIGLSPYVYLFTSASLNRQARRVYETARVLGLSNFRSFFAIILPISRPAWSAGIILVLMETISEFAAVEYFGINTLTLGIFQYWLERNDVISAARLAIFAGSIMLALGYFEHLSRREKGYRQALSPKTGFGLQTTYRFSGYIMCFLCLVPIGIGFILPVGLMAYYSFVNYQQFFDPQFINASLTSISFGLIAAFVGVIFAILLGLGIPASKKYKPLLSLFFINYMLPGTIFALGIMLALSSMSELLRKAGIIEYTLVGTSFGLIYGYLGRFLILGHGLIRNGLDTIPNSIIDAGRLYGVGKWRFLWKIKLPMLSPFIVGAGILIFVETIKELPMTLIMRPVGTESLATYLYQYASDENLSLAAPGALLIAVIGTVPLFLLAQLGKRLRLSSST